MLCAVLNRAESCSAFGDCGCTGCTGCGPDANPMGFLGGEIDAGWMCGAVWWLCSVCAGSGGGGGGSGETSCCGRSTVTLCVAGMSDRGFSWRAG